jgi:hypothetical protein
MPINKYDRVTVLLIDYRKRLTGSPEPTSNRLYDFIYEYRPNYQTELLDYIYAKGFEDGLHSKLPG